MKKNSKALNVQLDLQIHENLEQYCKETGLSKTTAVEKAISFFLTEKAKEAAILQQMDGQK